MTTHDNKDNKDTQHNKTPGEDASIGGVLGSMVGLVQAGAQFSVEQMQNAASLLTEPKAAMGRVKDSIDNLSNAMTGKSEVAGKGEATKVAGEPAVVPDDYVNGRKA